MHETSLCHFNLEWPRPDARVTGPQLILRGWLVGKETVTFRDVRARSAGHTWNGVLGFPRVDLAAYFKSDRPWLPAEFALILNLSDGPAEIILEACRSDGDWITLETLSVVVAPDGEAVADHPVRLIDHSSRRDPHAPFTGHLDDPVQAALQWQTPGGVFGWLQHAQQKITAVFATTDLQVFNQLDYDLSALRNAPESDVPLALRFAGHADLLGERNVCLRVYARLSDDSVHLCFAKHTAAVAPVVPEKIHNDSRPLPMEWTDTTSRAPDFPSGRPRRVVIGTLDLHENDATLRALDIARHLTNSRRWIVHIVSTVDGPLRAIFEAAGIPVQIIDPLSIYRAADRETGQAALDQLSRQIAWAYRDAAIIFDPLCFWMILGATAHKVPAFFDCSEETPLTNYFNARLSSGARSFVDEAWQALRGVGFAARTIARRQTGLFPPIVRQTILPHWTHAPVAAARNDARGQIAFPPDLALAVSFNPPTPAHGSAVLLRTFTRGNNQRYVALPRSSPEKDDLHFTRDAALNRARILMPPAANPQSWLAASDVVLNTALSRPAIRPLLDAAFLGKPIVTTDSALMRELFSDQIARFIPANDDAALANALEKIVADDLLSASVRNQIAARHDARQWLPRYHAFIESALTLPTAIK